LPIPAAQAATAALLQRLTGHPAIETHISAVFVGADEVWKLRKAVRMPFLDFSHLAERHRCALRELDLNAPHAPGLYRQVVPVTRGADGTLTLGGDGEPIDWVVRMARIPATDFFDAIAARGDLTPALLDALGDAVAACHDALPPLARDQTVVLRDIVLGNQRSSLAAGIDAATVQRWTDAALAALAQRKDWLRAREAAGYVRRAHGDLHLGNLCLWRGAPVPFDALEFNEDLATIDLGYDFAFLLMDLDIRVGRAEANRVLNRYVARTGDCGMLFGLPLFQSVRALVRAHIAAARGQTAECRGYLDHAFSYLSPPRAMVVAIGGLMGTGKSTLARALAPGLGPAPGALVLRSDEIRKRLFGVAPEAKLPPAAYTASASREVFAAMLRAVAAATAAGHSVIADATFLDRSLRAAVARAAGGVPFQGVWLQAPLPLLEGRVAGRRGDASDADVTVLRRAARGDTGPGDWLQVDATDAATALAAVQASTSNRRKP
jgi:aminoglycoside phosphotransferase family enzyme/predicted kinase